MSSYTVRGCIEEKEDDGSTNVNPFVPEEQAQFWGVYKKVEDGYGGIQETHQADFNSRDDANLFVAVMEAQQNFIH